MATGPEHYREAERLLAGQPKTALDRELGIGDGGPWPPSEMQLRTAQVHATLALAAATALNDAQGGMRGDDFGAWWRAAGEEHANKARTPAAEEAETFVDTLDDGTEVTFREETPGSYVAEARIIAGVDEDGEHAMPTRPDVSSTLTDLQSNGLACSRCGLEFLEGQGSRPTGTGSKGQLFAHADLSDCAEVAK